MARFPEPLVAVVAALVIPAAAMADDSQYLFAIPAQRLPGENDRLGASVQAVLHVPDTARAMQMLRSDNALAVIEESAGQITVSFGRKATMSAAPDSADQADSFVVDYKDPAVVELVTIAREKLGPQASIPELQQFVHDIVTDKSYAGDFELASKVAATRSGDCTEHAVLLTALARSEGYAARVVLGVVLLDAGTGISAYGHAWSEIHDGRQWQLADATLIGETDIYESTYYLPLLSLENEGPGYRMDVLRITRVQPSQITGIANLDR